MTAPRIIAAHLNERRLLIAAANRAWLEGGHYEHGPGMIRICEHIGGTLVSDRLEPRDNVSRWVWTDEGQRVRCRDLALAARARLMRAEIVALTALLAWGAS